MVTSLLSARPAGAQGVETIGTRAAGMGGAFVAVADDASATYWNPAGLPTGNLFGLLVFDYQRFEQNVDEGPLAGGRRPLIRSIGRGFSLTTLPIGVSYYRVQQTEVAGEAANLRFASLTTGQYGVSLAQSLTESLVLGGTFKIVRGEASAGEVELAARSSSDLIDLAESSPSNNSTTFDLDAAVMWSLPRARLGLVARNVRAPEFDTASDATLRLRRHVRAGVALFPTPVSIVAVDADLTVHRIATVEYRSLAIGAEHWWFARRLGVRAGGRASTVGKSRSLATAGVSVSSNPHFLLEASVSRGADHQQGWSIAARVTF